MKKRLLVVLLAVLAVAGICAAGPADPAAMLSYAPAGTDVIAYINSGKINSNRLMKALLMQEGPAQALEEFRKITGLALDDLMDSESVLFAETGSFGKDAVPTVSGLQKFHGSGDVPRRIMDVLLKTGKYKAIAVDGKPAVTENGGNVAFIALDGSVMQVSSVPPRKTLRRLTRGGRTALAEAVDTDALISIAFRPDAESRAKLKETSQGVFPDDVVFVAVHVRERGDNVDAELVIELEKDESVRTLDGLLLLMLNQAKQNCDDAKTAKLLERVKIDSRGRRVVVTLSVNTDEFLAALEPSPLLRAPQDTDAIVYIDADRIKSHRLYGALKSRPDVQAGLEAFRQECGFDAEMLMGSELFVFYNTKQLERKDPAMAMILRFKNSDILPKKLFDLIAGNEKSGLEAAVIDGRPALVDKEDGMGGIIAASDRELHLSFARGVLRCLPTGGETPLTEAVDTNALISIAFRPDAESRMKLKETSQGIFPADIVMLSVNIRERGGDLAIELVIELEKDESVRTLDGLLLALVGKARNDCAGKASILKVLDKIGIAKKGRKLIVSLVAAPDEIIGFVDSTMK